MNGRMCILLWIFHFVNEEINVRGAATYRLQTRLPPQTQLHPISFTLSSACSADFHKTHLHSPYNALWYLIHMHFSLFLEGSKHFEVKASKQTDR